MMLARGEGDPELVGNLREAQHSKHLMLLHAIAEAVNAADPAAPEVAAFKSGYKLLAAVQATDPGAVAWLLRLPHIGGWAHDCLLGTSWERSVDFSYLACAAAAAAIRAGVEFELDIPIHKGQVLLPGLGFFRDVGTDGWIRLACDGERLSVGQLIRAPRADVTPDDGSGSTIPHWQGTPLVRTVAEGRT